MSTGTTPSFITPILKHAVRPIPVTKSPFVYDEQMGLSRWFDGDIGEPAALRPECAVWLKTKVGHPGGGED
ncbi:MAG: hypothetical protein JWM10_712 [Myxococcaceae bacterium]|nr:hypothetical protein [Myxococcaceae bacterium]